MCPVKILIRLRECAGWSESSLGARVCGCVIWRWSSYTLQTGRRTLPSCSHVQSVTIIVQGQQIKSSEFSVFKIFNQRTTKPTIRLVRPAKTQISLRKCAGWSESSLIACASFSYPKRDKREPLPYWVDVQDDLSLCWQQKSFCRFCRALPH